MKPSSATFKQGLALAALVVIVASLTTLANRTLFAPSDTGEDAPAAATALSGPEPGDSIPEPAPGASPAGGGETGIESVATEPEPHEHDGPASLASETDRPAPMLCVVANGDPEKLFWQFVELHAARAAEVVGGRLEYSTHPGVDDRVRAIADCVRDGAHMILTTLADPEEVIPALQAAADQGVAIASFGTGAEHADAAGSFIHVSLNEAAAVRRAAEQFNSAGVRGTVLCLIPEVASAVGGDACGVLEETYAGGVVTAHQLTGQDPVEQIGRWLSTTPEMAGLLVLEADLLPDAVRAMEMTGMAPVLGSIGEYPLSKLEFAQRDQIAFTVMDLARFEVLLSAAALRLMYNNHPNARFFEGAIVLEGKPNVHTGGAKGGHERTESGEGLADSNGGHGHSDSGHGHEHGEDDH